MGKFMLFFLSWCVVFSWLLRVAGVDFEDDKAYEGLDPFIYYIIQAFRDAAGDFVTPSYSLWEGKKEESETIYRILVIYIWSLWFINILFMNIMLLNFLIAIISESYENVISKADEI